MTITRGEDGYFHPESQADVQALVQKARAEKKPLRVRGASHSVAAAIYTPGYDGIGKPPPESIDLMMDKFRAIGAITPIPGDPEHAVVEVEAGCNLGKNPYDPTKTSTWKNSLNYNLQQAGWALDDLGGISHQTVSGFLSTGSSGGSLMYSIDENLKGLTLVDGLGNVIEINEGDPLFDAAGVSMGLLGVIVKVKLKVRKTYNITGQQLTGATADLPIDFYGKGSPDKPSLEDFLKATPYTRLMWWPQHNFDRMQIWQAQRILPTPDFKPQPYEELGRAPQLAALAGSLFYTIIGNLQDVSAVPAKLKYWYQHLDATIDQQPDVNACSAPKPQQKYTVKDVLDHLRVKIQAAVAARGPAVDHAETQSLLKSVEHEVVGGVESVLSWIITKLVELLLDGLLETPAAQLLANWLQKELPYLIPYILDPFVTNGLQLFWDTWMCGLPMDNQMDDQLWPTTFTELWLPIERTADAMTALKTYYDGGGDAVTAYQHTGSFSCELYGTKASRFWMSPAYQRDVFRVDVFWFGYNAGNPVDFYTNFWEILKPFSFRTHWGKVLPEPAKDWVGYYRANNPRFDDFLKVRKEHDPDGVFLTPYWREHLAIAP